MSTDATHDDSRPPPDREKTMLFCPECGHESPITGDWKTATAGPERLLRCPVCGTVVDRRSRPRSDRLEAT